MAKLTLNKGTTANDGTGDTLRTAATKIENNFTELYTKLGDGTTLLQKIDFDSDRFSFLFTGANKTTVSATSHTSGTLNVVIPNVAGEVVIDTATQTLTNKELQTPTLHEPRISDADSDFTFVLKAEGHVTKDINLNIPSLADSDTFVFENDTQTLSNKTLETPLLNDPKIVDTIFDSSGNELIVFNAVGSAVTYVEVDNGTNTGTVPSASIRAAGVTNTNLQLQGTGTNGGVYLNDRMVLGNQTLTAGGTVSAGIPLTLIDITTAASHNLGSGVQNQDGEIKHILNVGAGTQTINEVSGNFSNGSTITLAQNASVTLVWNTSAWHVLNTFGTATIA